MNTKGKVKAAAQALALGQKSQTEELTALATALERPPTAREMRTFYAVAKAAADREREADLWGKDAQ